MNLAHVHLLLNHIPVLGSNFGLIFLLYAYFRKSQELIKTGMGILIGVALLTIPTFMTGDPARDIVKNMPDVAKNIIREHDDSAGYALTGILFLGGVCLAGLYYFRKNTSIPKGFTITVLLLTLFVCSIMIRTAYLGGQIHHPETRSDFVSHEIPGALF